MFFLKEASAQHIALGEALLDVAKTALRFRSGGDEPSGKDANDHECRQKPPHHGFPILSVSAFGEDSSISPLAISTATCTVWPRVRRAPVFSSEMT